MKLNVVGLVIFLIVVGALLYGYTALLERKHKEDAAQVSKHFYEQAEKEDGYISVKATVVNVDPLKGDLVVRLEFVPEGSALDEDGVSPKANLVLTTNASAGKAEFPFKKGEAMSPADVILRLRDGSINDYPNDKYQVNLEIIMSEVNADKEGGFSQMPMAIEWKAEAPGYTLDAELRPLAKDDRGRLDIADIRMDIHRTFTTRLFAVFLLALIWMLALCGGAVAMSVCVFNRKVELPFFQWLATLLFALLPLRNGLPGAPPIGSLPDYTTFFWAEAVIALSLVAVVLTWLGRKPA